MSKPKVLSVEVSEETMKQIQDVLPAIQEIAAQNGRQVNECNVVAIAVMAFHAGFVESVREALADGEMQNEAVH